MVLYFLLVNLYSLVLFALYVLFLRNSTNQKWPRFYLLSVVIISIVLPFIKMDITVSATQQMATFSQLLPEVILTAGTTGADTKAVNLILAGYIFGCSCASLLFLFRILKLVLFLSKHELQYGHGCRIALNTGIGPASFGNILIFPGSITEPEILRHELAHLNYKHHYDKIFISLVLCFFFPVAAFYFIKKELETVHEFEADAIAVHGTEHYARILLNQHFHTRHFSLLQSFFHHPIKRRIKMLYKNKTTDKRHRGLLMLLSSCLLIGGIVLQSQSSLMAQGKTKKNKLANPETKELTRENIKATGSEDLYYQEKEGETMAMIEPPKPPEQVASEEAIAPAEQEPQEQTEPEKIFTSVEEMPEFPGDHDSLMRYLAVNIRYPEAARKDKIEGRVISQFVVNEMGKVTGVKILRGLNADFDAETIRVLNNMPDWSPGKQGGKNVSVYYTLPITFKLK
jgi:TonB family protein